MNLLAHAVAPIIFAILSTRFPAIVAAETLFICFNG